MAWVITYELQSYCRIKFCSTKNLLQASALRSNYRWCRNDRKDIIYSFPFKLVIVAAICWHNYAKYSDFIYQLCPAGFSTTTEKSPQWLEYQNKIWCHEIQIESQGKTNHHRKNMGPNKGKVTFRKILNMASFSRLVKSCDCHNHITKSATLSKIWLTYIGNLLTNKFKGTSLKLTTTIDLLISVAPKMFLWNAIKTFYITL